MPRDPKFQSVLVTVRDLRTKLESTISALSRRIQADEDSDERGDDFGFLPHFCPPQKILSQFEETQLQAKRLLQQAFSKMDDTTLSAHETSLSETLHRLAPLVVQYIECKMKACTGLRDEIHQDLLLCRSEIGRSKFGEVTHDQIERLYDVAFYHLRDFQKAITEEARKPATERDWLRLQLTGWAASDSAFDLEEFLDHTGGNDE